jgi:glycosyltransferase involved in cell wall biosynthesis
VLFLGTGAQGAGALRFPPHVHIKVRQLAFCPAGWRQKLHYLWFCLWVLAWTLRWRPSWIYASDPIACPPALLLSYLPGRRVIYHEHDSPAPQGNAPSAFMRLVLWSRRMLARRARFCIFPNQQRAECFSRNMPSDRQHLIVWNCPRREEIAPPRIAHTGDRLRVLYHGSIVPDRLPPSVIEALAMLPAGVHLTVIGYETIGHRGYVQELRELCSSGG